MAKRGGESHRFDIPGSSIRVPGPSTFRLISSLLFMVAAIKYSVSVLVRAMLLNSTRDEIFGRPSLKSLMRRSNDSGGLKGVTTVRKGRTYAVNLPKFSAPPNANSINVNRDDVYEQFRKLTPKQRIAVLTIRDPNIAGKMYTISNRLWFEHMNAMRTKVGVKEDEDIVVRSFCNSFEYLFGDSNDLNDSDHEDTQPLLGKKSTNSSIATATNRPINSTFSYTSSDPTAFKPKLNFITTRDVLKLMMDGSKDFCASKARTRSRLLQRPEMWDRFVEMKDHMEVAEYESMIYQLMEFRVLFEYLNGGSGGVPFAGIKKAYPTDEQKWACKEQQLVAMEEASTAPATPLQEVAVSAPVPAAKKTRKQRLLEKIALNQPDISRPTTAAPDSSSSESEEEEPAVVVEPVVELVLPALTVTATDDDQDWIEVGASKPKALVTKQEAEAPTIQVPPRPLIAKPDVEAPSIQMAPRPLVTKLDAEALSIQVNPAPRIAYVMAKEDVPIESKRLLAVPNMIKDARFSKWTKTGATYVCDTAKAVALRTFIHLVPLKVTRGTSECPF